MSWDNASWEAGLATMQQMQITSERLGQSLGTLNLGDIDVSALEKAREGLEGIKDRAEYTNADLQEMAKIMGIVAEQAARIGEADWVPPDAKDQLSGLMNQLTLMGVSQQRLAKLGREYANAVSNVNATQGEVNRKSKESAKEEKKKKSAMEDFGRSVKAQLEHLSGIQLSLGGIIALVLKLVDYSNLLSGYAAKANAHFAGGNKTLGQTQNLIFGIRQSYAISAEKAGEYVTTIARGGFNQRNLNKHAKEMISIEQITGQNVAQQVEYTKNLISNYKELGDREKDRLGSAMSYLGTIRNVAKEIPGLSMDEAVDDVQTLASKTKVYNTDLQTTLAFYKSLMRQDIAEELGLGDVPREIRKEFVHAVQGFSKDLDDGWKAFLGKGDNPIERIFEFENLDAPKQFARVAEKIKEVTAKQGGRQGEYMARQLLSQLNFTGAEVQKVVAKSFSDGVFDTEKLKKIMGVIRREKDDIAKADAEYKKKRPQMIKEGISIARRMASTLEKIRQWVEGELLPVFNDIRSALYEISELLGGQDKKEHRESVKADKAAFKLQEDVIKKAQKRGGVSAKDAAAFRGSNFFTSDLVEARSRKIAGSQEIKTPGTKWDTWRDFGENILDPGKGLRQKLKAHKAITQNVAESNIVGMTAILNDAARINAEATKKAIKLAKKGMKEEAAKVLSEILNQAKLRVNTPSSYNTRGRDK